MPGRAGWICAIYALSGFAGLIYETIWIRQFSLSFGNTTLAFSTVISVFLGGLALGAAVGGRFGKGHGLTYYALAEVWVSAYALAIPSLMKWSSSITSLAYVADTDGGWPVALLRIVLCALILLPATLPMGAGLPWLAEALRAEGVRSDGIVWVYAVNTAGGALGAAMAGFVLLPWLGYFSTLVSASILDFGAGAAALWLGRNTVGRGLETMRAFRLPPLWVSVVAVLSGATAMIYEVVAARIAGLSFGPTAATVSMTLAVVICGLAAGAIIASAIRDHREVWILVSQCGTAAILLFVSALVAASPEWLAHQIRAASSSPGDLALLELKVLAGTLFPLMVAAGMALPLTMKLLNAEAGGLYGFNAGGSIAGSLAAGWLLIPLLGTERTLDVAVLANATLAGIVAWRVPRTGWRGLAGGLGAVALAALLFPRWDLEAMTSGAYKYAPYYAGEVAGEMHKGELRFLREGPAGTVTVRQVNSSRILAIDGKVDATDGGGDLLTEKLLAHVPLGLNQKARSVCVIGLASGVTAGSVLTYPVERLDILEVSKEVVAASHFFDHVNLKPLDSPRAHLVLNDGRNHLELTHRKYDVIISEPSNPWIAGMNSMFTREFFETARRRLNEGGVLAQWFHLYNMPAEDLRSLLRAFSGTFPNAVMWQLNEGDVLLTGFQSAAEADPPASPRPSEALRDLASAGVSLPGLPDTLYVMRGADLEKFSGGAEPNTDDRPLLEFHGQRNLHLQTDAANMKALLEFPHGEPLPERVRSARSGGAGSLASARGRMFEQAESFRLAFESYREGLKVLPGDPDSMAGMMRTARSAEEVAVAGTMETRTAEALAAAGRGETGPADALLRTVMQAFPERPEPHFNYGLFSLERNRYEQAIGSFRSAIQRDARFLPAYEAIAETYLRTGDLKNAEAASRQILVIDPTHAVAKQTLAMIAAKIAGR